MLSEGEIMSNWISQINPGKKKKKKKVTPDSVLVQQQPPSSSSSSATIFTNIIFMPVEKMQQKTGG